jgi:site-specific recombinase XerD
VEPYSREELRRLLSVCDLDLEGRRVRVIGKGGKIGIAPFCSKTAKALWAYLIERKARARCDALWVTEEGMPFSIEGLVSWFGRLKKRASVTSPGGVHRLRYTAAVPERGQGLFLASALPQA